LVYWANIDFLPTSISIIFHWLKPWVKIKRSKSSQFLTQRKSPFTVCVQRFLTKKDKMVEKLHVNLCRKGLNVITAEHATKHETLSFSCCWWVGTIRWSPSTWTTQVDRSYRLLKWTRGGPPQMDYLNKSTFQIYQAILNTLRNTPAIPQACHKHKSRAHWNLREPAKISYLYK